jgi:nitrate/nitrite transport system substrate-binding protein
VRAANTFPGGTHDLWIRYWLAAAGIDPNKRHRTITVPPAQMVANMKVGSMDTFCVCEPWNMQLDQPGHRLHREHHRRTLAQPSRRNRSPARDYVDANPKAALALTMAMMEAQMFCEEPQNKEEVARSAPGGAGSTPLRGHHRSHEGQLRLRHRAVVENHPTRCATGTTTPPIPSRATTCGSSPRTSAGATCRDLDGRALVDRVNREDIWRERQRPAWVWPRQTSPTSTSRGIETFFDGKVFDPENPQAYLDSLTIKRMA